MDPQVRARRADSGHERLPSRLGRFGDGVYELVCQLQPEEQDALLGRGGCGFLVRLDSDGMPEAALVFDPERPEGRRLLRHRCLGAERLA